MSDKNVENQNSNSSEGGTAKDQTSSTRRRLLKGAVGTAPVIFTVASRPVWARNCSLSGQLSGNLSDQDGSVCAGEGCTPGYWKNHPTSWHPEIPDTLLFDSVFGTNVFPGLTLGQVIQLCGQTGCSASNINIPVNCTPHNACVNLIIRLGFHAVAALQNAATPVKYDLTVQEVINDVRTAYMSGDKAMIEAQKTRLDALNNQYCPGGGGPACGSSFKIYK